MTGCTHWVGAELTHSRAAPILERVSDRLPIKMLHDRVLVRMSREDEVADGQAAERKPSGGVSFQRE